MQFVYYSSCEKLIFYGPTGEHNEMSTILRKRERYYNKKGDGQSVNFSSLFTYVLSEQFSGQLWNKQEQRCKQQTSTYIQARTSDKTRQFAVRQ
jgi:hypothetical protein